MGSYITIYIVVAVCLQLQASLLEACPKSTETLYANRTRQFLESPNYPSFYPRPAKCSWKIIATEGDIIVLRFFAFDLEPSIFCYLDYFSVVDGPTSFSPEILFMCGSFSGTDKFTTTERTAQIEFVSLTTGNQRTGFRMGYWTQERINAPYKDPEYTFVNYIMMATSVVLFVATFVFITVLIRAHYNRKRQEEDKDNDNLLHRLS